MGKEGYQSAVSHADPEELPRLHFLYDVFHRAMQVYGILLDISIHSLLASHHPSHRN